MSSRRRRFVMPVALSVALGVAACSAPTAALHRYGPPGYVEFAVADGFVPANPFDADAADRTGLLIGPHYSIQFLGNSVSRSVSAADAARYGFGGGPVQAHPGTEFFLAVVGDAIVEPGATAELVIGGVTTPLDRLPEAGESIAAVVPEGSHILLRVMDEGRYQAINLRDGTRLQQIDAFYNAALITDDPDDYRAKGTATGRPDGNYEPAQRTVTVSMTIGPAERTPWLEDVGWADEGKVWVAVPVSDIATDAVYGFDTSADSHEPMLYWKFKQDDVFRLDPDVGKTVTADGNPTFSVDASNLPVSDDMNSLFDPADVTLVFAVPEDAASATLIVAPTGTLTAIWKNVEGVGNWDDEPDEYTVDFEF